MRNSKGQAFVEYVLIVLMGAILITGLSVALFRPLGDFVQQLNQVYLQCLLETGELPSLRSESPSSICQEFYPQFQPRDFNGQPIASTGGGINNQEGSNAQGPNGGGSSGPSGLNSANRNRQSQLIRGGMRGSNSAKSDQAGQKSFSQPLEGDSQEQGFFATSTASGPGGRGARNKRKVVIESLTEANRKKLEREKRKPTNIPVESESFTQKEKKKFKVTPPETKPTQENLEVENDLGFYIRLFIMIIVALFIIIVFGTQALQISKNWGE